ncbi:PCNA-interacting partner [Epinephelus fuscoguttatus]|uniref:PCNA-interacting partner n=1 Tax=Epinephelus fuscoguttatus TaxID=293821 RepID=UPI0020CFFEC0|nr:PCNA-interacting partner [Epinephelus fuscoguttatus]XP_049422806.1 PCNA-interacting partner [Epinephelus fuscoguttatus]XP_049422807.1 PCNA-interacting partner [Epinephelus fuscoguttatus]
MEELGDRLKVMVKVFRRECHRVLHSERTTIHGADGMLMLLQLAMADINKQHGGEFKVALSDVLMAWKHLLLDKLHLPPPNFARLENYDLILEAYESFLKRSNTVDLVDILSMYKQLRVEETDPGEPVSPVELFEFLSGNTEVSELPDSSVPSTPSSKSRPCSSQVKTAVRRVFCSYLNLLVNIKNDLALALTLDVPSRTLGRQAFTDIKHAAQNNNTSLFLAVTSFVRAIQLGGKGYAPAESDPLRKHVKGLSDFVQFLDNLEEILGEIPDPSICGARLVTAVRAALVKGRSSGEAVYAAAEETTKELKERICQLHQIQKQIANGSGTGISPARPKPYAVNHCTAYGGRDTVKVLMALLDEEALTPPCQNKADLLSEDQPVLSGAEGTCVLDLFRSPEVSTGCSPEPLKNRVQSRLDLLKPKPRDKVIRSQFACTYKDEELPLNRVLEFPSTSQVPTCVHPAPKLQTLPAVDEDCSSDVEESTQVFPAKSTSECPNKEQSGVQRGAALAPRSGNAQNRGAGSGNRKKTAGNETQRKGNKRKQEESEQHGGSENEPPEKKLTSVSVKVPGKNVSKASSKKKLIAGQGKLTSFFRV